MIDNSMTGRRKKLIEVALPLKKINEHPAREKIKKEPALHAGMPL